jgi:N6-adenosine-specific RNA methylase IME4
MYPHGAKEGTNNREIVSLDRPSLQSIGVTFGESSNARLVHREPELKERVIEAIIQSGKVVTPTAVSTGIRIEQKRDEQKERFEVLQAKELDPIIKKYDVIVIDPPWQMEKIVREVAPLQIGFDYPTMEIDEIKDFKLPNADNCHVFLWITHKHLPDGFEILKTWGVKYVCCFVWHKNGGFQPWGLPQYNCEFVLYGRIGTPEFFDTKDFNVCFSANRTGHSEKPEEFYNTIRRVTAGKRIDIFNRRNIEGFDKYGNEA